MESESIISDKSRSRLIFVDSAVLISWGAWWRTKYVEGKEGRKKISTWWMD